MKFVKAILYVFGGGVAGAVLVSGAAWAFDFAPYPATYIGAGAGAVVGFFVGLKRDFA